MTELIVDSVDECWNYDSEDSKFAEDSVTEALPLFVLFELRKTEPSHQQ